MCNVTPIPKAQEMSHKRKHQDCNSQRTMLTDARQFLGDTHDREVMHIKSQQYDCLRKNCIMMTLVDMPTLMGLISQGLATEEV